MFSVLNILLCILNQTAGNTISYIISNKQLDNYTNIFKNQTLSNLLNDIKSIQNYENLLPGQFQSLLNSNIRSNISILFESPDFYSCKHLIESFKNVSSVLISHDIIDCEDFLLSSQNPASSYDAQAYTIVASSATVYQVYVALNCLMEEENINKFGVIFEMDQNSPKDFSYSHRFAYNLYQKFQSSTVSMTHMISINQTNYEQIISNSKPEGKLSCCGKMLIFCQMAKSECIKK